MSEVRSQLALKLLQPVVCVRYVRSRCVRRVRCVSYVVRASLVRLELIILLVPDSLYWMAANSESFVKDSATSTP
jgi:hypothetical protein